MPCAIINNSAMIQCHIFLVRLGGEGGPTHLSCYSSAAAASTNACTSMGMCHTESRVWSCHLSTHHERLVEIYGGTKTAPQQ